MLNRPTPKQMIESLKFDRFTIHAVGKELKDQIKIAEEFLAEDRQVDDDTKTIAKQVAIYYSFYIRNPELAKKSAEKFLEICTPNSLSMGEAQNLLGNALTIPGGYKSSEHFEAALAIFERLMISNDHISSERAFAKRYIALHLRRNNKFDDGLQMISQAINHQKILVKNNPKIHIDLAESLHIKAIVLGLLNRNEEALETFKDATTHYKEFLSFSGHEHFMKYITLQSLGSLLLKMNKLNEAEKTLTDTYHEQCKFYGTDTHVDIAKTLHFLGEVHEAKQEPSQALQVFQESLRIKKTINDPAILKVTQDKVNALKQKFISIKNPFSMYTQKPSIKRVEDDRKNTYFMK